MRPDHKNEPYLTVSRRWKEIEVLVVTGATKGKVEEQHRHQSYRTHAVVYRNPGNYESVVLMRSAGRRHETHPGMSFSMNGKARNQSFDGVARSSQVRCVPNTF